MKQAPLADALRDLMQRPRYTATAGLASKLSGVPRGTIVNWLEGRVVRPRNVDDLRRLAEALRFDANETAALFAAAQWPIPAGNRAATPAIQPNPAHVLPEQLTELIGRAVDVTAIRARLTETAARLVTLVGPGGVGKTHLAIEVADGIRDRFPDGVIWISLAATRDPALVLSEIAHALGIHDAPERALLAATQTVVRTARVLLVVDNFEHVVHAASVLTDLLAATQHAKILVTSRFSLRLRGEHEVRVEPLARPGADHVPSARDTVLFPAVALFTARARAVRRDFTLDDGNAADVAAICERVDGLPLAIELAAAQARALAPSAIAKRLAHPLAALADGARNVASRHRSLRETIAWSYGLLSEEEQRLFRRLAVFAGSISQAGASASASASAVSDHEAVDMPMQMLDRLRDLVDRSLLSPAFNDGAEPRFRMLATIREFAGERLAAAGDEEAAARSAHGRYMLAAAQCAERLFTSEATSVWSRELRLEHDNIRAVLTWLIDERNDAVTGARLVAALGRYWFELGHFLESRLWLERVVSAQLPLDAETDAKLKLYLAFVANYDGDYSVGRTMALAARAEYLRLGDRIGDVQALNAIGIAAMYTGDHATAEQHFTTALHAYEALGERRGVAVELHNLGEIASECRFDFHAGEVLFGRSLDIFLGLGHTLNVGMTLGVLAECHAHAGAADEAVRSAEAALAAFRLLGHQPLIAEELARLATFALDRGDLLAARTLLVDALDRLRATANPRHHARCFEAFAMLAHAAQRPRAAARIAGFAERIRREHTIPALPASARRYACWTDSVRDRLGLTPFRHELKIGARLQLFEAAAESIRASATV